MDHKYFMDWCSLIVELFYGKILRVVRDYYTDKSQKNKGFKDTQMARCAICDKKAVSGSAVSHSQIHTKRTFKPNLQKVYGVVMCTRCIKTLKKHNEVKHLEKEVAVEAVEEVKEEAKDENEKISE